MRFPCPAALAAALLLGLSACGGSTTPPAPICTDPTTCPLPLNACLAPTCAGGQCGQAPRPVGTKISDPTPGDCQSNQCDGAGNLAAANDDADLPSATSDCTTGTCDAGAPVQQFKPAGDGCASGGGVMCDGAGTCVECLAGSDCTSGAETDVDCGGGACPPCADGRACALPADCQNLVCTGATCQAASCADLVHNGAETDVDCGGGACPLCADGKACTAGTDCSSGACRNNVCASPQGATCTVDAGCASGFCVDGVCCNTACFNGCEQCNLAGSVGTCTNSLAGTDPRNACTDKSAASCSTTGVCTGTGSCQIFPPGTVCAGPRCSSGQAFPESTCDGSMSCVAAAPISCGAYLCGPTACLTSCTGDGDCAPPATCQGSVCQ